MRVIAGRPPLGCFRCAWTEVSRVAALARVGDVEASRLAAGLDDAFALVAGRFFRREVRARARGCLTGMLSGLERKTGWALAGHAGEKAPDGMQRLFTTARWDQDLVRDDVRSYVIAALGDRDGVLIGDDTGFEKKGDLSAGVQRQYTGTAGKITNCQLGVFLAYAGPRGRALIGRELYLPRSWTGDEGRLAVAKVPDGTAFRTKPQLLQAMIGRAVSAGIPFSWVTADEAYGDNGPLRGFLEESGISYVLAVSRDHVITTPAGRRRADTLPAGLPEGAWQRISCGDGARGRRWYDRALIATSRPEISLLIRRNITRPSELAFYLCHTPGAVPLARLVKVAGARWAVEECFQAAKNEAGIDHYQVRLYKAWYRYVTLAMLALAFLAVTRAALADNENGLVSSANEIRRMFTALCSPPRNEERARHWSRWRHQHQQRARRHHYQRQQLQDH
jgi:SRSO17 transposase